MCRKLFVLILALILLPGYTADDAQPWENGGTFFNEAPLEPVDELITRCPVFSHKKGACVYNYPILQKNCTITETKELGVYGTNQFLLLRTLKTILYNEGQGNTYSCKADEIALFERTKEGKARAVWHNETERDYFFISDAKLYSSPTGRSILSVLYCLNGTGGCVQGSLIWTDSSWEKLERDDSWKAVYAEIPEGYRRHKSPPIDFSRLTWEEHLAGPNDPNCCPTGRINFDLALKNNKLSVKTYKIFIPEKMGNKSP